MIEAVGRDLQRGLKNPETGRNGLTPSRVLRSIVLKSVKSWDLRELRERIADGYTLRQFTEFYCQPVPNHHAFNRAFHRLTPETVKAINELVVNAAVDLGLEELGGQARVQNNTAENSVVGWIAYGQRCRLTEARRPHAADRRPQHRAVQKKSSPALML
jgi:IS5 family transposase